MDRILERLAAQDRVLAAILSALAPEDTETGPGLGDLIMALQELTVAVDCQGRQIAALQSTVSAAFPNTVAASSRAA